MGGGWALACILDGQTHPLDICAAPLEKFGRRKSVPAESYYYTWDIAIKVTSIEAVMKEGKR